MKDAERRDKLSVRAGKDTGPKARPVETFHNVGDAKNGTAGLRTKSNLRVKRRDPWHRANAPPKAQR